ncbi:MAG: dipeptidase [Aggregatilineales bacterium]
MSAPYAYARQHSERSLNQLFDFIRIPSVSTLPEHAADVRRAAEWLAANLRQAGFEQVEVVATSGHPIVYAEWMGAGPSAPTVLVYGHYDVQPADIADGWDSDPFEPTLRDGFVYARGASDDKGQVFAQVKAAEALLATGGAPVNLKFIVEGEEEVSSLHLGDFVRQNAERLKADVCVISDTGMLSIDQPAICYSLRGLVYTELHVWGPAHDLHSGSYGGSVHNPAQALAEIIAALHNPDGSVSVPGFYDDVLPLSPEERAAINQHGMTEEAWRRETGADQPWGEAGYTIEERIGARPTLEINGMVSGFYGDGAKTVLPARALAKISCRLVANQNPQRIYELVRDYIAQLTPPTVRSELRLLHTGAPAYTDINTPAMRAAVAAYQRQWGASPIFIRGGGSIPIVADFQTQLGLPVVLLGFGLTGDGAHGPNERFSVEMFHRGIATAIQFFQEISQS